MVSDTPAVFKRFVPLVSLLFFAAALAGSGGKNLAVWYFCSGGLCLLTLIAIPTGTVEYLILRVSPSFPTFEVRYFLRDTVYMIVFVGIGEELLFRGLIQRDLIVAFGWKWGIVGASFMFAVMHLTWRSVPELGFVFVAALILGGLYYKTKSLTAPIIMHGVNNVMLVAVWPYLLRLS